MRRVLNKEEVMMYESFIPKKGDMDGNQVRLLSCGFPPTSSPCAGLFSWFPWPVLSPSWLPVSLGVVAPNPRILFEFVGIQRSISLCDISCIFQFSETTSGQDTSPPVLNSGFVHTLPKVQASTVQQILLRGVMTPSLLPVRPGFHSIDVGLL